jgi:hypothetical protein
MGLRNVKLTSSRANLHKTTKTVIRINKNLDSSRNLNLSKKKQSEILHDQKINAEIERFRKAIEKKYYASIVNREYVFPRKYEPMSMKDCDFSDRKF